VFDPTIRGHAPRPNHPHLRRDGRQRPGDDVALSIGLGGRHRIRGMRGLDGPDGERRRHPSEGFQPGRGRGHGHGRPRGIRPQVRRGAIREALLGLLAEQPMHGYQLMQELAERSGGRWHPSAGSVYPTLQQLEDEGLIVADERDGRRTFSLTEAGQAAAAGLPSDRPWARPDGAAGDEPDLRGLARELGIAALQVTRVGSPAAVGEARTILTDARRQLYRLLADDETTTA